MRRSCALLATLTLTATFPASTGAQFGFQPRGGFGTEPEDVPADIRQALLLLVGYWFEHRDAVIVAGSGAVVPSGFDRMVAGYKRVRL